MSDLINNLYLPDFTKRNVRESDTYKLLEKNKMDTSVLEGYETTEKVEPIEFPVFNSQSDKDKFVDENATATATGAKDYLETFGNFLTDETEDLVTSLGLAAVNGSDIAVNLMPLAYKMFEQAPIAVGLPKEFFNKETEDDVMRIAKHFSDNLGDYREHLFEKQKDNGWVKDILSLVVQDSAYSIPAFNYLRKAGVSKYKAFFLSGAIGALGVENKDKDGDKTYFAPFSKDLIELKNLLNILPDTPADMIADEVHQALEYGTFGLAIPKIIDALKFMKKYIPAMTATAAGTTALTIDNEAEGSPIKSILKAVDSAPMFKSAVVDATDKIPAFASGDQIYNTIKNTSGVKASELKWMDLEGFLKNKKKVSKGEVLEYINANKIDVSEVKKGGDNKQVGLSTELRKTVDDYETRWRDSDLADGVTPNYDVYRFGYRDYVGKEAGPTGIMPDVTGDWQSTNRNPLILAMDEMADMVGYAVPWRNIEARLTPWEDMNTGKYTGHVIEVEKGTFHANTSYHKVSSPAYEGAPERYIVASNSLEAITDQGLKFKKINTYEMDKLELEKFTLEDEIRNYNLSGAGSEQKMPVYAKYTEPGGDTYTELVFKVKNKNNLMPAELEGEFGTLANNKVKAVQKTEIDYKSPHFGSYNEFAHVRFKTRTLSNGKKVLTVEEMQSDLLQASKTELFASTRATNANQSKVLKDFPFKNNWYEFTIKRLTRYAADNGFDAIAIPKGELAANRYGSKILKIKSIDVEPMTINKNFRDGVYYKEADKGYFVRLNNESGEKVFERTIFGVPGEDDFFKRFDDLGKDIGEQNLIEIQQLILQADDTDKIAKKVLDEISVAGSGKGKFHLYNKTIPGYMKKYAKKWNAKVYDDGIVIEGSRDFDKADNYLGPKEMPVTVLELSPEMKTGVTSTSQPLFELFGTVALSTWGAKAVSDNMKNNSISQTTN